MKRLRFVHGFAEEIRSGRKTVTWRVNDNKDIVTGDRLELIDEVDPEDPSTWQFIGHALVTSAVEKKLKEVDEEDMRGHETFASQDEMLATYQQYGGPDVTLDSPVKIIHFELTENES